MSTTIDRNNLAFWFPLIERAGLPVPRTEIVTAPSDLTCLLDGELPGGWLGFLGRLREAGNRVGWPCFLRTGHGSAKHEWNRTCCVAHPDDLGPHVAAIVEWSHLVDMMGLPTSTWAVRHLLPTTPLFYAFDGFPVTREFRFFVRDGQVEHRQPYWPQDSIQQPTDVKWAFKLGAAAVVQDGERKYLEWLAQAAGRAVGGGYWSVDVLQDRAGGWWVTDMALGDQSFRYDPYPVP